MSIKFYRKQPAPGSVTLANGQSIPFTTLDHRTGYFATDSQYVQTEFERLMKENRGGITEVSAEDFTREYIEKKSQSPLIRSPWREEIGAGAVRGSTLIGQLAATAAGNAVVAAANGEPAAVTAPTPAPAETAVNPPVPAPKADDFKPTVGKRKRSVR